MDAAHANTHDATYEAPPETARYRMRALIVGVAFLVLTTVVAVVAGGLAQFFRAYLVGFFFCTGLAIGSLAWLMLGHMTGGAWAMVSRRLFEAATRTVPLLALLFIPLLVGVPYLYEWSHHEVVAVDPALQHKSAYLNVPFFIARAVFYFAVWLGLAYLMNKWSREQDATGDPRVRRRLQDVSGPGILLFGLTVTFAAVDWGMSLEPHWFSTIYGLIAMAGWGLSALALMITVLVMLSRTEPMRGVYAPLHFHDFGKLLLAMVMLYAYFSFSQFLIIWSGNLPEEITFYLKRLHGGWQYVGLAIILFHFALPFTLLLSRGLKRHGNALRNVALLMIVMRIVDLIFLFAPAAHHPAEGVATEGGHASAGILPMDFLTMFGMTLGLGGLWLAYYFWQLPRRPLLPLRAPELEKSLAAAAAHH